MFLASILRKGKRNMNCGFTLMELLVVIAIIGLLAGLIMTSTQAARRKASINKAKAEVAALESALEMYQQDMGEYPQGDLKQAITALTVDNESQDWYGPYIEFKRDQLDSNGLFIDPWGTPYYYKAPAEFNPNKDKYDLYSFGPNRQDDKGEKDDIAVW